MRTHPVFLCLEGRPCVVIGGDAAAEAKVEACLRAGASVAVVAPQLTSALRDRVADGQVRHVARAYQRGDLDGAIVAYASERDPATIDRIRADAIEARVLLNVIDVPGACAFITPAVVTRGDLQVAISTGGASPGLASRLRQELERVIGPEYAPYVAILAAVRERLSGSETRLAVLAQLLDSGLLDQLRAGDAMSADATLRAVLGETWSLVQLGVDLPGTGGR